MLFRIADTFTDSLVCLTGDEQKAAKTTAFDLQMNPVNPGMQMHRIDNSKDRNFWSVRAGSDIRIIVHKTAGSLLLCYVDHHDRAYQWAERRKLETHPKTGAAQFVEVRERIEEIVAPPRVHAVPASTPKPTLFAECSDHELLGFGVPAEWLADVRKADEDSLLDLVDHLPGEAAEALLELATGGKPRPTVPAAPGADPFSHPDAQRRFRIMGDVEELARALEYPWEKWTVFLHPEQRQIVEGDYPGPVRVSGSAGTGKTIVALHRAVHLARVNADSRVLLATFSDTLASALRVKLRRLISNEPRLGERLEVHSMDAIAERLYERQFGRPKLLDRMAIRAILAEVAAAHPDSKFTVRFLLSEWHDLVDAWQLDSWEAYRDVKRLGRKTRLPEARRQVLWSMFDAVRARLSTEGAVTRPGMFFRLAEHVATRKQPPFEFAVIDEAQDISVAQLKFLAALGADRPNSLFFAGDLGQRIFRQPFSWLSLGVDIRGRSRTLRVNYRTSHQIRMQADRLLGEEVSDVDGNAESRRGTISVFNGPPPTIRVFDTRADEVAAVGDWLSQRIEEGVAPHEIGIFVRTEEQLPHARDAATQAGLPFKVLDEHVETTSGQASLCTMHLAKGLEFRAVAVMACDDEIIPLQERIESVADDADLEEVYDTERHLLYVACTRARDQLLVTSVSPESEFLDDLRT
jgi:hypothetical protein